MVGKKRKMEILMAKEKRERNQGRGEGWEGGERRAK